MAMNISMHLANIYSIALIISYLSRGWIIVLIYGKAGTIIGADTDECHCLPVGGTACGYNRIIIDDDYPIPRRGPYRALSLWRRCASGC